jgi:putative membrane protein insertion efficiency factor
MTIADAFNDTMSVLASIPRQAARGMVKAYRLTLSPFVGMHCRHLPTCSVYADEAFSHHGFWAGGWITLARLSRCHPFGTSGLDVVPDSLPETAHWYVPWRYGRWRGTDPGL